MKAKNVVGSLSRTKELIRALKGLDPVAVPKEQFKPTLQFFKQLKFLSAECEDKTDEGVKVRLNEVGLIVSISFSIRRLYHIHSVLVFSSSLAS